MQKDQFEWVENKLIETESGVIMGYVIPGEKIGFKYVELATTAWINQHESKWHGFYFEDMDDISHLIMDVVNSEPKEPIHKEIETPKKKWYQTLVEYIRN